MNIKDRIKGVFNRQTLTLIFGLAVAFFVIISWPPSCKKYDTKSITSQIEAKADILKKEVDSLKKRIEPLKDTVIIYRDRYRKAKSYILYDTICKTDTVVKNVILYCDSALAKDSTLISEQTKIIGTQGEIITALFMVVDRKNAAIEDTTKYFRKEVRRGKVRSFLKGFGLGFAAGAVARELKP